MNADLHIQGAPAEGFSDPVQQSQVAFRGLLDAMSRPGRIVTLPALSGHPAGLAPALAAALLTLCDLDTPIWLGPDLQTDDARNWLRFHTGAPVIGNPAQASVAVLKAGQLTSLAEFSLGTDEAPERGATVLVQVSTLQGIAAMTWRGPGIKETVTVADCGLPTDFWQQRAALGSEFPRGIDLYLISGHDLLGLPRSTAISIEGA